MKYLFVKCKCYFCKDVVDSYDFYYNKWTCKLCKSVNSNLNDKVCAEQLLNVGSSVFDIIAPDSLTPKHLTVPSFLLYIDVSRQAYETGFLHQFVNSLKNLVPLLDDNVMILLVAVDRYVYIYNLKSTMINIVVEPETYEYPSESAYILKDVRHNILTILDRLLSKEEIFDDSCFGTGLYACYRLLKRTGGIIIASYNSLPNIGSMQIKTTASENMPEKDQFKFPHDQSITKYSDLGLLMNRSGISLYLFSYAKTNSELKIASIICGLTSGYCYRYDNIDFHQIYSDVFSTVVSKYYWFSMLSLSVSKGIKQTKVFGNFKAYGNTLYLSTMRNGICLSYDMSIHSNTILNEATFQFAFSWTDNDKIRRIRIFNLNIPVTHDINDFASKIDEDLLNSFYLKNTSFYLLANGSEAVKKGITNSFIKLTKSGNLRLNTSYMFLYQLTNRFPFIFTPKAIDIRWSYLLNIRQLSITDCLLMVYPRLIDLETDTVIHLNRECVSYQKKYLLHSWNNIYVIGFDPSLEQEINATQDFDELSKRRPDLLPVLKNIEESFEISNRYLRTIVLTDFHSLDYLLSDPGDEAKWLSECMRDLFV